METIEAKPDALYLIKELKTNQKFNQPYLKWDGETKYEIETDPFQGDLPFADDWSIEKYTDFIEWVNGNHYDVIVEVYQDLIKPYWMDRLSIFHETFPSFEAWVGFNHWDSIIDAYEDLVEHYEEQKI